MEGGSTQPRSEIPAAVILGKVSQGTGHMSRAAGTARERRTNKSKVGSLSAGPARRMRAGREFGDMGEMVSYGPGNRPMGEEAQEEQEAAVCIQRLWKELTSGAAPKRAALEGVIDLMWPALEVATEGGDGKLQRKKQLYCAVPTALANQLTILQKQL